MNSPNVSSLNVNLFSESTFMHLFDHIKIHRLWAVSAFGTTILLGVLGMSAITHAQPADSSAKADQAEETLYQCSMHPSVVSDEPGTCPICGMDLQPVQNLDAPGIPGRAPVNLSEQQRQLININTVEAIRRPFTVTLEALGVVEHDESKVFTISAWAPGRIEKLYVAQTETDVEVGDPLYSIYSPKLFSAMQEYLTLTRSSVASPSLLQSARVRLLQMGLSEEQLEDLKAAERAPLSIDVHSPMSGKVMMKMVREGQYVDEGENLYTVVDLSELWLIAEVYESDLPFVKPGQAVIATSPAVPDRVFPGKVQLINHHIDSKTRTAKLRIVFDPTEESGAHGHPHGLLPEMWMRAQLETPLGERIVVPRSAVFDTGRRQHVFVEVEPGVFAPREVTLGASEGGFIVIRKGVAEGEAVVTKGTFLLDSESLLKASASGSTVDAEGPDRPTEGASPITGFPPAATDAAEQLWEHYFQLRRALFQDEPEAARQAFTNLRTAVTALGKPALRPATHLETYREQLDAILTTLPRNVPDLETARIHLGNLSVEMLAFARRAPSLTKGKLAVLECPMWEKSPSIWLQPDEDIRNPYMGQAMPQCGTVQELLPVKGGE